jgi:hypothetical protein
MTRRLADQGRLLACALLVVAMCTSASAETATATALLKRLDLVGYRLI